MIRVDGGNTGVVPPWLVPSPVSPFPNPDEPTLPVVPDPIGSGLGCVTVALKDKQEQ